MRHWSINHYDVRREQSLKDNVKSFSSHPVWFSQQPRLTLLAPSVQGGEIITSNWEIDEFASFGWEFFFLGRLNESITFSRDHENNFVFAGIVRTSAILLCTLLWKLLLKKCRIMKGKKKGFIFYEIAFVSQLFAPLREMASVTEQVTNVLSSGPQELQGSRLSPAKSSSPPLNRLHCICRAAWQRLCSLSRSMHFWDKDSIRWQFRQGLLDMIKWGSFACIWRTKR